MSLFIVSILIFVEILLVLVFTVFFGQMFISFLVKVPTINSKRIIVKKIVKLGLKPGTTFIDLGCNDAKLIGELSKIFPTIKFIGVEKNIFSVLLAKINNKIFYQNRIDLRSEDIFKTDLSRADYIYMYLYPEVVDNLKPHILRSAKKNAIIISNSFPLKDIKPTKTLLGGKSLETLYVYEL